MCDDAAAAVVGSMITDLLRLDDDTCYENDGEMVMPMPMMMMMMMMMMVVMMM